MQINTDLEQKLRNAYEDIINRKKSLRTVSTELQIDRKEIKKLMQEILSESELEIFKNSLSRNNNKLKDGKRNKKAKAINREEYKKAIISLADKGILPEQIEAIFNRCQERKQTKLSRDTLAIKLEELLNYCNQRNEGLKEESDGFMANEDVIQMVIKNPRIISGDIKKNFVAKCSLITVKNNNDVELANVKIKRNPGIFRKTIKDIEKGI